MFPFPACLSQWLAFALMQNEPPVEIGNNLKFSPSLTCESSMFSLHGSLSLVTTASADFSQSSPWLGRPPSVRAISFSQFPPHLLSRVCCLWALVWCVTLPAPISLICDFCPSVPTFVVLLPSMHRSPYTILQLTNGLISPH
jgi:hypothetical protein